MTIYDLLEEVKKFVKNRKQLQLIQWAYNFAYIHHKGQTRHSGEPYIIHPLWTGYILAQWRMTPQMIAAGLLHDVLEDTPVTYEKLTVIFGHEISGLVNAVTKVTYFAKDNREQLKSQYLRKLYLAMAKDIRVIIIKMADRLHNIRTIRFLPPKKQYIIAKESLEIYKSIAERLGMTKVQHEFEEICFKVLEPREYGKIKHYLATEFNLNKSLIEEHKEKIRELIVKKHKIPARISGRTKSIYSIYNKMTQQGKKFNEIQDILAIRIITTTKDNCYLILGYIHAAYTPIKNRFKDYIASPKPNLYQSLHTSIVFPDGNITEIQIRTEEMDKLAETGIASHWKYKETDNGQQTKAQYQADIDEQLDVFRHILDLEQITQKDIDQADSYDPNDEHAKEPLKLEEMIEKDVFSKVVYALTPNGKVITLPFGSRILDFAYQIHSEVGDHTVGAKINGVMLPLASVIHSGDVVEIKTSKNQKPSHAWLALAKTSRARNKIRRYLRSHQVENQDHNKSLLQNKKIKESRAAILQYIKDNNLQDVMLTPGQQKNKMKSLNIDKMDTFLLTVAQGEHTIEEAAQILFLKTGYESNEELISNFKVKQVKNPKNAGIVFVQGLSDIKIQIAKCCLPIPYQPIIGSVTKTNGISVHNKHCKNVSPNHEREVEVFWNKDLHENVLHEVNLKIIASDRPGLVADITNLLSRMVVPIHTIKGHLSKINFTSIFELGVQVKNTERLRVIMSAINALPDIKEVVYKGQFDEK